MLLEFYSYVGFEVVYVSHIIIEINCKYFLKYGNGFDQRVARQHLCKHGPTSNNRGSCAFRVRGDVTQLGLWSHDMCFL
jgi:hypothetical protein